MAKDVYIFEVSTNNFDQVVLQNSHKIPVVLVFMGVWSKHCFALAEIFSLLAKEFAEEFILAKVDIDEQPDLRDRYEIENVPTINVIIGGEVSLTEEGLFTHEDARILLKGLGIYNQADALRDQAREKHMNGDTQAAIILLSQAMQKEPSNTRVALDMVQIFIDMKEFDQANGLLNKLPDSAKDSDMGKSVSGQLVFINLAKDKPSIFELNQRLLNNSNDNNSRFDLSIRFIAEYQYQEALDQLFVLHQYDAEFNDGAAKELLMTLINMLKSTNPDIANAAQIRLSNLMAN